MSHSKGRIKTVYMDGLAPSYSLGRDKRIIDLLVYLKYYCPHDEYVPFIGEIEKLLLKLQGEIRRGAFDKVRSELGIKDISHLQKLCQNPKRINYNMLSKM